MFNVDLTVINPYNQQSLASLPYDNASNIEKKINALNESFTIWQAMTLTDRIAIIKQGLTYFQENKTTIAKDISLAMGKPITQSLNEINGFFERANYCIEIASNVLAPNIVPEKPGFIRRIEHVPLGIIFNIAAWNYPLLIPVNIVIPALLSGNVVLLKHSAKTALIGQHFHQAFGHLEIKNLLIDIIVDHNTTTKIIQDNRIAHVAFTGSVPGGREIYQAVATSRFIDVGLELGGNDPAYISDDVYLDAAVTNVVDGACYNAGQSCCAVERVYVHEKYYDEFLQRALSLLQQYQYGDPLQETTTMGPLASRQALNELEHQVSDALKHSATLLTGGKRLDTEGNFFPATLLSNVDQQSVIMQEESFGPVLPVLKVKNHEQALKYMNDSCYGLTASIWTNDNHLAEYFAQQLNAGTVFQNRCDYLDPALPWTGYLDSGKGSSLSAYGFYSLTKRKSIHFNQLKKT